MISGKSVQVFLFGSQVQPKHVKEAFRLLNKSIIRVETPDINLDQDEELEEEEEQQHQADGSEVPFSENLWGCSCTSVEVHLILTVLAENGIPNGVNGVNGEVNGVNGMNGHTNGVNGHADPGPQPKPSLRLSFNEYRRISNLLVLHLRRVEEGKRRRLSHHSNYSILFCWTLHWSLSLQLKKRRSSKRVRWWTGICRRLSQRSTPRRPWSARRLWSRRSSIGWCTMWVYIKLLQSSDQSVAKT